jgi:hypothetical protein
MLRFIVGGFPALFALLRSGDLALHLRTLAFSRVVAMTRADLTPWHCQGVFATVLA